MAKVQNNRVGGNKKKVARKVGNKNPVANLPGFDLPRFSNDVLTYRNGLNMTQRQLAKATGVTSAAIVFIENGKSFPITTNFARICQFLKLQPADYIPVRT